MAKSKAFSAHEPSSDSPPRAIGSDRSFGFVAAGVFAIVAILPLLSHGGIRLWALLLALTLLAIAWFVPHLLAPLNRLWAKFGEVLNAVVSPVVLALLFFAVLTPYGAALRLFGKDLLGLRFSPDAKSYWILRRPPGPAPKSMNHQF